MNTEQERADFEAWYRDTYNSTLYCEARFEGWQAGRAALQSQPQETIAYVTRNEEGDPAMLFFDLKEARLYCNPDEEPEVLVLAGSALQSQEYTSAIGGAGQAYLDRFKNAHALPAEFRWSELWAVMCVAANKGRTDATQSQDRETCSWSYDESDGAHQTSCGNMHIIIDGTPDDNGVQYCCYCGGRITPAIDHARRSEGE